MNSITDMFEESPADLDTQLAVAADVLQKVAAEHGMDLDLLTEEETAGLLSTIMGGSPDVNPEPEKVAMATETEQTTEPTLTHAEVSLELMKRAAAEGLDLSALDAESYEACFAKVAEEMADPEYAEKVAEEQALLEAAQAEEQQKLAHTQMMEEMGRVAARGFVDELNKLAAEEEAKKGKGEKKEDGDDEGDEPTKEAKDKDDEEDKPEPKEESKKDDDKGEKGDDEGKDKKPFPFAKKEASLADIAGKAKGLVSKGVAAAKTDTGKAALKGGAAGAVAGGVAGAAMSKKANIEEEALKLAHQILIDNGINPETGERLEATKEASDEELIQARAQELLREAGWLE